jgi:hypothetical protein
MGNAIDERLGAPVRDMRIDELPRLWRYVEIAVTCPLPPIPIGRLDLLRKLRGAFGDQLLAGASGPARRREPCDWDPPCASDVLFRHRPIPGVKAGAPSPFVLSAEAGPDGLTIRLTLFGFAEACAAEAAEALVRGLRAGLSFGDDWRIGFEPRRRLIRAVAGIERQPPAGPAISLVFETPAAPRSEGKAAPNPVAVLRGMFDRVVGLARWYGAGVPGVPDWLNERLAGIAIDASELVPEQTRFRPSPRAVDGGYEIEPRGGTLRLSGDWASLWPLLAIGEVAHAGGRATDGYGRFRLVPG